MSSPLPPNATHAIDLNVRLAFAKDPEPEIIAAMRLRLARMIEREVAGFMGVSPLTSGGSIVSFAVDEPSYRWLQAGNECVVDLDEISPVPHETAALPAP